MTTLYEADPVTAQALAEAVGRCTVLGTFDSLGPHLAADAAEDTVVVGPSAPLAEALSLADALRLERPDVGVVVVRRHIDTAMLNEALRAGVRDVVDEADLAGLSRAVHRSRTIAAAMRESAGPEAAASEGPRGRVLTMFATKGGCGKTVLATNLAAALAGRGRRNVCLVDLSMAFGDVAISLQLYPSRTLADLVPLGLGADFTAVQSLLTPHSPGLTTLVAPVEPGATPGLPPELVGHLLRLLRDHFDFVVVDTPHGFDDAVLAALDVSDHIVLVATLDIPALKNLSLALTTLQQLDYPPERLPVVLNRADAKVDLPLAEVERTLKVRMSALVPSSRDVPMAVNRGVPIVLDDPRHPVSVALCGFAETLAGPAPGQPGGAGPAGGPDAPASSAPTRRSRFRLRRNP